MTDEQLKVLDKKSLRLTVKELIKQRDDLLDKMGKLNLEIEGLNEERKLLIPRLEKAEKDFKHEQDKVKILEENLQRLGQELLLAQSNRTISIILHSTIQDFKNLFRKKGKKFN